MSETPEQTRRGLSAEGLDAVWSMIVHAWSIETREFFEREGPKEFVGPADATPLLKAIHHMWKRDRKVEQLLAERDMLIANVTAQAAEIERLTDCPMLLCPYEERAKTAEAKLSAVEGLRDDLLAYYAQAEKVVAARLTAILEAK